LPTNKYYIKTLLLLFSYLVLNMLSEVSEMSFSEVLVDSSREVFETMIFMSVEEAFDEDAFSDEETINASILFKGPITGGMVINCSKESAKEITANMLAMESGEEISDTDIFDAMNELANLVMGAVKTRIYSELGDIQVSIPSIISSTQMKDKSANGTVDSVLIEIDGASLAKVSIWYR
jgi:chemotaxis protein CheX